MVLKGFGFRSRSGFMGSLEHDERHWTEEFETWLVRRDRESSSGVGSSLVATEHVRSAVEFVLMESDLKEAIRVILDIPCGDWNWMRRVDLSSVSYTGADIVRPLIARNRRLYGSRTRRFEVFDLLNEDAVPREYDLVFCRDLIVHFTPGEGVEMLKKIARGSRYLMATTFPERRSNDHAERSWYPCNLERPPFSLPPPLYLFCEHSAGDKSLGVWRGAEALAALEMRPPDRGAGHRQTPGVSGGKAP